MADAPQITVTPEPCPWGFNPANREPNALELAQHELCTIEDYIVQSGKTISTDTRATLDSLWATLGELWAAVADGTVEAWAAIQGQAQSLLDGVNAIWGEVVRETQQVYSDALWLAFFAIALFMAPELARAGKELLK